MRRDHKCHVLRKTRSPNSSTLQPGLAGSTLHSLLCLNLVELCVVLYSLPPINRRSWTTDPMASAGPPKLGLLLCGSPATPPDLVLSLCSTWYQDGVIVHLLSHPVHWILTLGLTCFAPALPLAGPCLLIKLTDDLGVHNIFSFSVFLPFPSIERISSKGFFTLSRSSHYNLVVCPIYIPFSAFFCFPTNWFLGEKLLTSIGRCVGAIFFISFDFCSFPDTNAESDWGLSATSPLSLFPQFCLHLAILYSLWPSLPLGIWRIRINRHNSTLPMDFS